MYLYHNAENKAFLKILQEKNIKYIRFTILLETE